MNDSFIQTWKLVYAERIVMTLEFGKLQVSNTPLEYSIDSIDSVLSLLCSIFIKTVLKNGFGHVSFHSTLLL